jgi:hypothetical protein
VAGGMDFRAMLMRKKKPAKKVVVVSTHAHILLSFPLMSLENMAKKSIPREENAQIQIYFIMKNDLKILRK